MSDRDDRRNAYFNIIKHNMGRFLFRDTDRNIMYVFGQPCIVSSQAEARDALKRITTAELIVAQQLKRLGKRA